MRKKWGIILGLTGMMLLGSQSIYAAEAADGTAETTDAANEKETAGTDDIESRIKKGGFTAGVSVHDPSTKTMTLTTSLAPIWNLRSLQI